MTHKSFLEMAAAIAELSTCISHKVGAVITSNNQVLCSGYNDTPYPPRCGEGGCERCQKRLKGLIKHGEQSGSCKCIHAEIVAISNLDILGINKPRRLRLYVTIPPCKECAEEIFNHGITEVYYYAQDHEGAGIRHLRKVHIIATGIKRNKE